MNTGADTEWVYIDMKYDDDTFGQSQPMTRLEAKINMDRGLVRGRLVEGKRVREATIVFIDPQPTAMLPIQQGAPA
jgi:hypothetical protein